MISILRRLPRLQLCWQTLVVCKRRQRYRFDHASGRPVPLRCRLLNCGSAESDELCATAQGEVLGPGWPSLRVGAPRTSVRYSCGLMPCRRQL